MGLNLFSISGLLLSFICLIVIFLVLKYGTSNLHRVWALFNFVLGIWGIGCFFVGKSSSPVEALFWLRFAHVGIIFLPIVFLHHICLLCEIQRPKLLTIAYLQGIFFLFLNTSDLFLPNNAKIIFDSFYYTKSEGLIYPSFFVIWIGIMVYSYVEVLRFYRYSQGLKRSQVRYFILGTLIGFSGGITNFFPHFGIYIYPFGNFVIPIYCIIFTYAILRYRLMDINIVFKKTMVYSLSAGLLTGIFIVFVLAITKLLSTFADVDSFVVSIFAALLIALLFNPLRQKVQLFVDKVFYKKTYDYFGAVRKVSHDLASMFDLKDIFKFVGDTAFETLGLKNIYLLSASPGGNYEVAYSRLFKEDDKQLEDDNKQELIIKEKSDIVKLLRTSDDIVIKDELPAIVEILGQETLDNISNTLKPFDGAAMLPVFVDDKLALLIVLGEKLSGDIFTDEDIKLLNTVSHQTAIAVKNAMLYGDKLRSEKFASIGIMSATFAHEIRNPLTSVKTFAQLLPEKFNDDEFRETFAKIVVDDIGRIDGLIKDLLSFSSKESAPGVYNLDITEMINGILEYQKGRFEFERNNISLEKKYKDTKINIQGDSKKLKQAFINIISNGCQAMEQNGALSVDIVPNGREVNVTISDTGKGMSHEEVLKIFEPFYTTRLMGVGLGLAISKKIIEDHGGRITVESRLSRGTTFTVSLPVENNFDNQ